MDERHGGLDGSAHRGGEADPLRDIGWLGTDNHGAGRQPSIERLEIREHRNRIHAVRVERTLAEVIRTDLQDP